jgi:hypothetical protein
MRYAIIKNDKVDNIVEADEDFASEQGWILCPTHHDDGLKPVNPGDSYINNQFVPKPKDLEMLWKAARFRRDTLLIRSDVMLLADRWASLDAETQQAWTTYRQELRDFPANNGAPTTDPTFLKFPIPPDPSFDYVAPRPE